MTRKARLGSRSALTPSATMRSASMSKPESVSSRMARRGLISAICNISIRFFSPREADVQRPFEHLLIDLQLIGGSARPAHKVRRGQLLFATLARQRVQRRLE